MENGHLQDDKLFRAVHDRLSDYEAPANGADWDAMSRSLDSLPKSARYRWKISLNTILILLGVVGVSALSFALVTKSGKSPNQKTNSQITVTRRDNSREQINPNQVKQVNNPQPTEQIQNSFASNNDLAIHNGSAAVSENTNPSVSKNDVAATNALTDGSKKRKNKNQLLFGDQIDPKKGFIYNTKENPSMVATPVEPASNVFYDSENGKIKKIEINLDSLSKRPSHHKADSTAKLFTPGAPTEGGTTGFDMED